MSKISFLLFFWFGLAVMAQAQAVVPVQGELNRQPLVTASGKVKRNFFLAASPGASYALHFYAPTTGPHILTGVQVHLQPFGHDTARGQVRVRIASVTATGGPAEDDLLPIKMVLTESVLQAVNQSLLLDWPGGGVNIPATGFFLVLEGLGNYPDEYTTNSPASAKLICPDCYTISRRNDPNAQLRLVPAASVPMLLAAKPDQSHPAYWMRGGHIPIWQPFLDSKEVPLLEVFFD